MNQHSERKVARVAPMTNYNITNSRPASATSRVGANDTAGGSGVLRRISRSASYDNVNTGVHRGSCSVSTRPLDSTVASANNATRRPLTNRTSSSSSVSVGTSRVTGAVVGRPVASTNSGSSAAKKPKKRAAWDVKGQIEDIRVLITEAVRTRDDLQKPFHYRTEVKWEVEQLMVTKERMQKERGEREGTIRQLREKSRENESKRINTRNQRQPQISEIEEKLSATKINKDKLDSDLAVARVNNSTSQSSIAQKRMSMAAVKCEIANQKLESTSKKISNKRLKEEKENLAINMDALKKQAVGKKAKLTQLLAEKQQLTEGIDKLFLMYGSNTRQTTVNA